MSSSDDSIKWDKIVTAFADDLRKYSNDWENNSPQVILNKLKVSTQPWEHLLFMSGGKLELDKCALYTIQWMFSEDGIAKLKNKSNEKLIIQSSQTGKEHDIKILSNNEYFQYLGINHPLTKISQKNYSNS